MDRFPEYLLSVLDIQKLSLTARSFVASVADRPDLSMRLAKMGSFFHLKGDKEDAEAITLAARALAPDDFRIRAMTAWLDHKQAPLWHFSIVHDHERNATYARALQHFVEPGMIVFEIGTGTGILAMLAARAGAKHVYTCEIQPEVANIARQIIKLNGFEDRITVINKDGLKVKLGQDIPERADLFVAELVDNTLLGEHVLPLTEFSRKEILKPDAILLPRTISARGCLIRGNDKIQGFRLGTVLGLDLSPFNYFSPLELNAGKGGGDVACLSDDIELASFDLTVDARPDASNEIHLVANSSGVAEGVLRWLHLDFGDGIVFENRPPQKSAWDPHIHVFPEPLNVKVGDKIKLISYHDRTQLLLWPETK